MEGVDLKPIELWAVVESHLSGERTIIGTFTDFESAHKAYLKAFTTPRRWNDDTFSFAIINMVKENDYLE